MTTLAGSAPSRNTAPIDSTDSTHPGDLAPATLRAALHRAADLVADYVTGVDRYPVIPKIAPGAIRAALPSAPPQTGEPMDAMLADYLRLIEPNTTHWRHPGFMAYFPTTGSGPGVVAELLAAGLNNNAMLWRTGPASTELEEHVCDWLRQMVGLPAGFHGHINDTASISTLLSLAAARERAGLDIRRRGMAGRSDVPTLTIYCSDQTHSSIDKAALTLGIGVENCRRVATNARFELDIDALEQQLAADKAAGCKPIAIVATIGTTSTTAVDPVAKLADIAAREGMWLHVDGAYAGSAAICPEMRGPFAGWERADSIVINPHKWLFVPKECSVLWVRDPQLLKQTFSVIPAYLTTTESVTNLMDLGIQLGRRFRSLKLWMVLRSFGVQGLQERIRFHCDMARELAGWIKADDRFELTAPVPFATVCFRATPPFPAQIQDQFNERLVTRVNAEGPVFVSHTTLKGRYCLRISIGNLRTTHETLRTAWKLINDHATKLMSEFGAAH